MRATAHQYLEVVKSATSFNEENARRRLTQITSRLQIIANDIVFIEKIINDAKEHYDDTLSLGYVIADEPKFSYFTPPDETTKSWQKQTDGLIDMLIHFEDFSRETFKRLYQESIEIQENLRKYATIA